jgi:hypothetical protein
MARTQEIKLTRAAIRAGIDAVIECQAYEPEPGEELSEAALEKMSDGYLVRRVFEAIQNAQGRPRCRSPMRP